MAVEPFLGEISMFGGNFAPAGWAFCNGQLLPIAQNSALFALLGTTYGGDGRTTFGLPDLRGRAPIHFGSGPGLTPRVQGQSGGTEAVTLTAAEMPSHGHPVATTTADQANPASGVPAIANDGESNYASASNATSPALSGGGQPHGNMPPFQVINYIIALQGSFPSRS